MKKTLLFITSLVLIVGCSKEPKNKLPPQTSISNQTKEEPNQIIKKDTKYGVKEIREEYVTTDWDCRLLPNPDSNYEITRIPKNTKLRVIESKDVQQGYMLNKWYKVEYEGEIGWTSSFNMKSHPEVRITTREEMLSNYEKKIGEKPINSPLSGKIPEVVNWLRKNKNNYDTIKYRQWYEPFPQNNKWVCRVQYDEVVGEYTLSSDMLFYIVGGKVINVVDKNY